MMDCDPRYGKYLATGWLFRGVTGTKNVDQQLSQIINRYRHYFVDWVPDHVFVALCNTPPLDTEMAGTFLGISVQQ